MACENLCENLWNVVVGVNGVMCYFGIEILTLKIECFGLCLVAKKRAFAALLVIKSCKDCFKIAL